MIEMRIKLINGLHAPFVPDEYLHSIMNFVMPELLRDRYVVVDVRYFWTNKHDHRITGSHQPYVRKHRVYNFNEIRIRCRRNTKPIITETHVNENGYIDFTVLDKNEFFVFIFAHEFLHQLQDDYEETGSPEIYDFLTNLCHGCINPYTMDEYSADRYAFQCVRRWRKFMNDSYLYYPRSFDLYEKKLG